MQTQTQLALLALAFLGSCGTPKAGFSPRMLSFDVNGSLLVSEGGATVGANIETLGLSEDSSSFAPRADFEWGAFALTIMNSSTDHAGVGTADATHEFGGGQFILPGENVATDFDLGLTEIIMTWDMIPGETVDLSLGFGVTMADLNFKIASLDNPGIEYGADESLPIPMIAGRLGLVFGDLSFEALVAGLSVDVDGDSATIIDMDIGVQYNLLEFGNDGVGAISLGYRSFDLEFEFDDDGGEAVDFDIGFSGLYFGMSFWI